MNRQVVVACVLLASCAPPEDRPATWAYIHGAIVAPGCATTTCHGALGERAGLVLQDADDARAILIERRDVVAGDPSSPLLSILRAEERARMPPDAPLPTADIELIEAWIVAGAEP